MKATFFSTICLCLLIIGTEFASAQDRDQLTHTIEAEIKPLIDRQFPDAERIDIQHRSNQNLGHLANCEQLQISNENQQWLGQIRLRVQCLAPSPWQLFWPVSIDIWQDIVVLQKNASRGEVLTEEHLGWQFANISQQRQGFYSNPNDVLGGQLSRHGQTGMILHPRIVSLPSLVRRGDELDIILRSPGIELKTRGQALANGRADEQILFVNLTTGQTVRARIHSRQLATIDLQ